MVEYPLVARLCGIRGRKHFPVVVEVREEEARLERLRGRLIAKKIPFEDPLSLEDAQALEDFGAPHASTLRLARHLGLTVRVNASRLEVEDAIRANFGTAYSTSEPATVVQLSFLRQLDADLPEDVSRAEAAYLIERAKDHPSITQQNMLKFFGDPSWQSVSLSDATERLEAMFKVEAERREAWDAFAESCRRLYRQVTPNMVEFDSWRKHLPESAGRTRVSKIRAGAPRRSRFPQVLSYAKTLFFAAAGLITLIAPFLVGRLV